MLSKRVLFKYYPTASFYHALSPACKFITLILMIITILLLDTVLEYGIYLICFALILLFTNIPASIYLKQVKGVSMMMLVIFLLNTLFGVSMITSLTLIIKTLSIVLASSLLMLTTLPNDLNQGIEKVLMPFKKVLPIQDIAMIISLALRFIPTILESVDRILISEANRGLDVRKGTLKEKIEALRYMMLPTFILTLKRSDEVADIMTLRLYGTCKTRTTFKEERKNDFVYPFVGLQIILIILMMVR